MKKFLFFLFLSIFFCTNAFASSHNCKILGKQNIPSNQDFEYKPLIKFPKTLKIKLSIEKMEGNFHNTDAYFNNYKFEINKYKGFYSNSDKDIKFEIKSLDNPYNSNHNIKFFLDFDKSNNSYKNLWVDHFWQGGTGSLKDYDARYKCDKM